MYIAKKVISRCNDSREGAHLGIMREMAWQASLFMAKKKKISLDFRSCDVHIEPSPPSEIINLMNRHIAK